MEQEEGITQKSDVKKYRKTEGVGVWHEFQTLPITDGVKELQVMGMMTGCGLAQMVNVTLFTKQKNLHIKKEDLIKYLEEQKEDGVGAVLCVLGKDHYAHHSRLEQLGFKQIAEYANYRHSESGSYTQRLYILTL